VVVGLVNDVQGVNVVCCWLCSVLRVVVVRMDGVLRLGVDWWFVDGVEVMFVVQLRVVGAIWVGSVL